MRRFLPGLTLAGLSALLGAAEAPAVTIVGLAQDRAVSVDTAVATTVIFLPPGTTTTVTDSSALVAPDFAPFDATATVAGFTGTESSQNSTIGTTVVTATGSHAEEASGSFVNGVPATLVLASVDTETRFSLTFSLSEASAYELTGSVFTSGSFVGLTASEIALTGPGGTPIAGVSVASDSDCLDPSCADVGPVPLDASGVLAAGTYVLEAWATGAANAFYSQSVGFVVPGSGSGSFDLQFRLVPEPSTAALVLLGGALLGAGRRPTFRARRQ